MALQMRHTHEGEAYSYHWGFFHMAKLMQACEEEGLRKVLGSKGSATLQEYHEYTDYDGEVLAVAPGDVIEAWR